MSSTSFLPLACFIVSISSHVHAAEPLKIPMTAVYWHTLPADSMGPKGEAQFVRKEGFPQGVLVLKVGSVALEDFSFRNGTIEYDFKPLAADMPGIQFRVSGAEATPDGEEVYQRMFGDERASNDGMQYAPMIHGFMLWNVYPQYQNAAPLIDGWNHVRLVVSGERMKAYINRWPEPALSIGKLESGSSSGAIHLRGPAIYANMTVTPDAVDGLPAQATEDSTAHDAGMVRHWQVSALAPLIKDHTPTYAEMPSDARNWRTVEAERGGLLNLNRQFTASEDPPSVVWLRFNVTAHSPTTRRVSLGWLGQTWIYVNGKFLTTGKNFYDPESERRDPDGRLSLKNGSFDVPLVAGKNEIAIALYASVHDDFHARTRYGWGAMMRFTDFFGLSFSQIL